MVSQVISIGPDGGMSGLQVKPGKGLDLRQFGAAEVVRASEIIFDVTTQAWAVQLLDAPGHEADRGKRITTVMATEAGLLPTVRRMITDAQILPDASTEDGALLFHGYDVAVEFEIAYLDAWRLKGRH